MKEIKTKYIKGSNYNIIPYEYEEIDWVFIQKIHELFQKQPFKWYEVFENVIGNIKYSYIRDTSMIISLNELEEKIIINVFEMLKIFLRCGCITKIIYKKEYVIVELATLRIGEILKTPYSWMIIDYYYLVFDTLIDGKVYLQAKLENDKISEKADLVIITKEKVQIINAYKIFDFEPSKNHFFYTLQLYKKRGLKNNDWTTFLQYYFSKEMQIKTLYAQII